MNAKNPDLHIDSVLERHAPMKAKPGQVEHYNIDKLEGLAGRLGVSMDQLAVMAESGLLTPLDGFTHSEHGSMAAFDGADLDSIRRGAILAGLEILHGRNPELDSHDLAAVAETARAQARRKPMTAEFSTGVRAKVRAALTRAKAGAITFSTKNQHSILMQVGAKVFGIEFSGRTFVQDEGGVPLTGKVVRDRFVKKLRDDDIDRGISNATTAGLAGAGAAVLAPRGRLNLRVGKRSLIGAGLGVAGVLATRAITDRTRDVYGERSRTAKSIEGAGPLVATGIGAALLKKRLTGKIFSRAEKDILFSAFQEQTGRDLRCLQSAYDDPDFLQFAIASLLPMAGKFLRGAGRQLLTPGTTVNQIAKAGAVGTGAGGVVGATGSLIDGDTETGILGGFAKGATTGAAIGAGGAAIRGMSPEALRRAKSFFTKAGPLQTPSGPPLLKAGPRFRWSGPDTFAA